MNLSQHAAIEYAEQGLSVIPLVGKRPPEEWTYYQSHLASKKQIELWWGMYRDANVGVVTGSISNLFVVDFDYDAVRTFTSAYPIITRHLGDDFIVSRTGKGFHCIIRTNEAKMLRNKKVAKSPSGVLIETRGEGGYIVAPPSIHPDTGRQYQITNGKRMNSIGWVDYDKIVKLLGELNKQFNQVPDEPIRKTGETPNYSGVIEVEDIDGYLTRMTRKVSNQLSSAVKGERNNELFRCAAALGTLGDYLPEDKIYEILLTSCAANGVLQEEKSGTVKTIRSALRKADRVRLKENPWLRMGITIGE